MTTNNYDHAEAARVFTADRVITERAAEVFADAARRKREAAPLFMPPEPARLRAMSLPNGKFLLVLDGYSGEDTRDGVHMLNEACEEAGALVLRERIDVVSWPDADLAESAAEACAMTHGEDDDALIGAVRGMYAAQAAEAEAWRMGGATAVERVEVLEAALREIQATAAAPVGMRGRTSRISQLADDALGGVA